LCRFFLYFNFFASYIGNAMRGANKIEIKKKSAQRNAAILC